jgi:hypothetical protein
MGNSSDMDVLKIGNLFVRDTLMLTIHIAAFSHILIPFMATLQCPSQSLKESVAAWIVSK